MVINAGGQAMMRLVGSRRLLPLVLAGPMLLGTACQPEAPSPYAQVQQETTQRGAQPAVDKDATPGGSFNKFFPKSQAGFDRVFTQEKKGFSEAKLNKGGKTMAMLSISDAAASSTGGVSPTKKFETASKQIAGFPAVDQGTTQTAILVSNRYQVKVQSRAPEFTTADRATWIQKFDLNGLSNLK
jgi:hypothetical protein